MCLCEVGALLFKRILFSFHWYYPLYQYTHLSIINFLLNLKEIVKYFNKEIEIIFMCFGEDGASLLGGIYFFCSFFFPFMGIKNSGDLVRSGTLSFNISFFLLS